MNWQYAQTPTGAIVAMCDDCSTVVVLAFMDVDTTIVDNVVPFVPIVAYHLPDGTMMTRDILN